MAIFGAEALRVPSQLLVLASILACGWALYQLSPDWLLIGAMLAGMALLAMSRYRAIARQLKRPLIRRSMLVLAVSSVVLVSFVIRLEHDVQRQIAYGSTQDWLDAHLTDDDRLGYVLVPTKYLLYGRQGSS